MDGYDPYAGIGHPSAAGHALGQPTLRRTKSSRLGHVLRKLLGRKSMEDEASMPALADRSYRVGAPSPALGRVLMNQQRPIEFITSAIDVRDQRTLSMPASKITRSSALGSHAPFSAGLPGVNGSERMLQSQRPGGRRASMPSIPGSTPEPFAERLMQGQPERDAAAETGGIGYAITSDSLSNRRSRSADALRDMVKSVESSTSHRHRAHHASHEVSYWEDSRVVSPDSEPESGQRTFLLQENPSSSSGSHAALTTTAPALAPPGEEEGRVAYKSYDFNGLAVTFNEQETIPLEERMTVAEVKLMDLEYALSKMQPPESTSPSNTTATPLADPTRHMAPARAPPPNETPKNRMVPAHAKSEPGSGSTAAGTVSTQPTAPSLSTAPGSGDDDPFVEDKLRPLSVVTSVHRPADTKTEPDLYAHRTSDDAFASGTSSRSPARSSTQRPLSLTSISIDHFTTLITLLKREQHARIRLEAELADLRHEVWNLLHPRPDPTTLLMSSSPPRPAPPVPTDAERRSVSASAAIASASGTTIRAEVGGGSPSAPGGSLYRQRRWDGSRRDMVRIDDLHLAPRRPSHEGREISVRSRAEEERERERDREREREWERERALHREREGLRTASAASSRADTETSEVFATPVEQTRFEIAAGLWGRGDGEAF